jgi:hypothetical protein
MRAPAHPSHGAPALLGRRPSPSPVLTTEQWQIGAPNQSTRARRRCTSESEIGGTTKQSTSTEWRGWTFQVQQCQQLNWSSVEGLDSFLHVPSAFGTGKAIHIGYSMGACSKEFWSEKRDLGRQNFRSREARGPCLAVGGRQHRRRRTGERRRLLAAAHQFPSGLG